MEAILTRDEALEIIKPLPRHIRAFHCGFGYIETWLASEGEMVKHGLDLNPDFQRGHVWSEQQQLRFIENVLREIVDESGLTIRFNCPSWRNTPVADSDLLDQAVCIDGLQRLTAVRKFIAGEVKPFGYSINELGKRLIMRDRQIVIKMHDFQYRKDLLQFYLDLNSGGTVHSNQELERVRTLLKEVER